LNRTKEDLSSFRTETEAARQALESVSGPEAFVVEKMKEQQQQIMSLTRETMEVQQENTRVRREVTELRQENSELREEMRVVLAGRKQLEELRKRVERMRRGDGASNNQPFSSSLDGEEDDERKQSATLRTSFGDISLSASAMSTSNSVREVDQPTRVSSGGMGVTIQGDRRRWHTRS